MLLVISRWLDRRLPYIVALLTAVILFTGVGYLQFSRHFVSGSLNGDGMDMVQTARILARTHRFSTNIVRPFLTARLSVNGDGTSPDFAHAPLYPLLLAVGLRATGHARAGEGDREAALLSLLLYGFAIVVTAFLGRRLFGKANFGTQVAILGMLLFAFGGSALTVSLMPNSALLCAVLFGLLILILYGIDCLASPGESSRPLSLPLCGLAGALFGLLFLSIYSALLLLPALLVHIYRVVGGGRRSGSAIGIFLALALAVSSPWLLRNQRLAHNPLYNAHLLDFVQNTESFPGYGLLGTSTPPRSLSHYLLDGGLNEIASKASRNLIGMFESAPVYIGFIVFPLFAMAALTRFVDGRVNRIRNLTYVCLGCHVLGLSPFQPYRENAPLLLMYAPVAAIIAGGFLLSVIRARNLPVFHRRGTIVGWSVIACLPGILQITAATGNSSIPPAYDVYNFLNKKSLDMVTLRDTGAYLIADSPWAASYWLDVPVVWLPSDSDDMLAISRRTGRPIGGVLLTPALAQRSTLDSSDALWVVSYRQIVSLTVVVSRLNAKAARSVIESTKLYYPSQLSEGMKEFSPVPFLERGSAEYSLLFWNRPSMSVPSAKSGKLPSK